MGFVEVSLWPRELSQVGYVRQSKIVHLEHLASHIPGKCEKILDFAYEHFILFDACVANPDSPVDLHDLLYWWREIEDGLARVLVKRWLWWWCWWSPAPQLVSLHSLRDRHSFLFTMAAIVHSRDPKSRIVRAWGKRNKMFDIQVVTNAFQLLH